MTYLTRLLALLALCLAGSLALAEGAADAQADTDADNPQVLINTNHGTILIELFPDKAPETVANFLKYVAHGWYDGTIFHRVIPGFMIQGGGFTADYQRKETDTPIRNEADNGLHNKRGSIAMARTQDPHSASSQFFINTVNNVNLDHRNKSTQGWGYTVFGEVVEGMDVVDRISGVATGSAPLGGFPASDVPRERVIMQSVTRLTATEDSTQPKETAKP